MTDRWKRMILLRVRAYRQFCGALSFGVRLTPYEKHCAVLD
jgi:hypothetical protein